MTGGERAAFYQLQNCGAEAQQAQGIRDGRAGFSHPGGRLLLCHFIGPHQLLIAKRLFNGIEIRALQVFDERQLHGLLVVGLHDDDRHVRKSGQPGRAPAAFPGDDLIEAGRQLPHRQRLDDAVHPDGFRKGSQLLLIKGLSGLQGIGLYFLQGQRDRAFGRLLRLLVEVSKQGAEALAETFLCCHIVSTPYSSFARISFATAS